MERPGGAVEQTAAVAGKCRQASRCVNGLWQQTPPSLAGVPCVGCPLASTAQHPICLHKGNALSRDVRGGYPRAYGELQLLRLLGSVIEIVTSPFPG